MIKEIKFTDKALKQINYLLSKKKNGVYFRIAVKGGGCSGYKYDFSYDENKNEDDQENSNIIIDNVSANLLKGSEIDFVSEEIKKLS